MVEIFQIIFQIVGLGEPGPLDTHEVRLSISKVIIHPDYEVRKRMVTIVCNSVYDCRQPHLTMT